MGKTLVAYFSVSGRTAEAARDLADAAGADIYRIEPEIPYVRADLNWIDPDSRTTVEMHDRSKRPAIVNNDPHIAEYDQIFICFPIWWYTVPTIINTFLESYDFSGKTILLFATSGGSGLQKTLENVKDSVPESTVIREGRMLNGRVPVSELRAWLKERDL